MTTGDSLGGAEHRRVLRRRGFESRSPAIDDAIDAMLAPLEEG